MNELSISLIIIAVGFLATEPWRWLGINFSKGFNENSEIIKLTKSISIALIAALVIRLLIQSPGDLANIPLIDKVIAMVIAVLIYLYKSNLILSIGGALFFLLLLTQF